MRLPVVSSYDVTNLDTERKEKKVCVELQVKKNNVVSVIH
jgi:hypothetical protein